MITVANLEEQQLSGSLAAVDPVVRYPSYRSFDEFVDIERLRSLDGYIRSRIERHIFTNEDPKFYTGPFTLQEKAAGRPGSRMIYLSESSEPDSYFDLDRADIWHPSPASDEFILLMDFIKTLPFKSTGRMMIMYDDRPREVPAHRDHTETEVCHEFLWFRTNLSKPFYLLNVETNEKQYVNGYTAWFDSVNQFHGSEPCDHLAFSIRVDGRFTDAFKARIPLPRTNLSSTPSYWACIDEQGKY